MANKFEIKILKEANGEIAHLKEMSLQASQSLVKIIEGVNKIVEAENNPDIKVRLVEGCVGVQIDAPPIIMAGIQDEITKVLKRNSNNLPYLEALRGIQSIVKANGISYGDNILVDNKRINLVEQLKESAEIRRPQRQSPKDYIDIDFFNGKLMENGGVRPNINIETQYRKYPIKCNISQARRVSGELYNDIRVSAWVTLNPDRKNVYTFCDYYRDPDIFEKLKSNVRQIIHSDLEESLDMIYEKFHEFISEGQFEDARLFVKTFCHIRIDNNILRTLLIVMKGMRQRPEFQDLVKEINELLVTKTKKVIL